MKGIGKPNDLRWSRDQRNGIAWENLYICNNLDSRALLDSTGHFLPCPAQTVDIVAWTTLELLYHGSYDLGCARGDLSEWPKSISTVSIEEVNYIKSYDVDNQSWPWDSQTRSCTDQASVYWCDNALIDRQCPSNTSGTPTRTCTRCRVNQRRTIVP